jgi:hypothetical protein
VALKVYIAAPWVRKDDARIAAAAFEAAGFTITKRWWEHPEVPGYLDAGIQRKHFEELRTQAHEDWRGVMDADFLILLNLEKSEGKAVETGLALMYGVPILLIGGPSNLFHYLADVIPVDSVADAILLARGDADARAA